MRTTFKDLITIGLSIWGLMIANSGLSTWKKQLKGGKEFDVSYELNKSILKLRESIKYVRNPAIWPVENREALRHAREKRDDITDEEIKKNSHALVYEMRWQKITNAYTEVESHLLEAEVLWGKDIVKKVDILRRYVNELNLALTHNFRENWPTKDSEKIYNIIYNSSTPEKDDEFSEKVNNSINEIQAYLKNR